MTLTIEQRDQLLEILPRYEEKATGRKRANIEQVFYAILWVLESGARWSDIDKYKFGVSYQTCHRYFQEWVQNGLWRNAWQILAQDMQDENVLKLSESFVDGSFVLAKKGGI
jgi:transposase